jgi:ubiquinone/menaquinone biosynthesis C-methylase UbiE
MDSEKKRVHDFWDAAACGEALYLEGNAADAYHRQSAIRYQLEPYILYFAEFKKYSGARVLEIGVGLGADHQKFAEAGAVLTGVDLTPRAVSHTAARFEQLGLESNLQVADAERLAFPDASFDLVYSWGVLHHSPDTQRAIEEVYRVLKPGGEAKIMIYHKHSILGYMLWARHALLRMKPWLPLAEIYAHHLESPGTKAYTTAEARKLFSRFADTRIQTVLTHADLLESDAGQRHRGMLLTIAKRVWPRGVIRAVFPKNGLFMLINAVK